VIFGLGSRRRPRVHQVIGCVNINTTQIGSILEQVDGDRPEPVVDLPAIDRWWCAILLNLFGEWALGRYSKCGGLAEQGYGLLR
jgi:hypothetical protein